MAKNNSIPAIPYTEVHGNVERARVLQGGSVPSISLCTAVFHWVQACTTAAHADRGAYGQAAEILSSIDTMLRELRSDRTRICSATIWIKRRNDYAQVVRAWNEWVPTGCAPVVSYRTADMARDELLVEIRVDAVRGLL